MIERITDYPGYLIRFRPETFSRVILQFHGLPAHRGTKNMDLAEHLSANLDACVYLLHYRGLGESRGVFRFTESITEGNAVAKLVSGKHRDLPLTVLGHSWGGMVATNVAYQCPELFHQLMLISPFVKAERDSLLHRWLLEDINKDWPGIYGDLTREELEKDLEKLYQFHQPFNLAARMSPKLRVGVLQASRDDVTPLINTKAFASKFQKPPLYQELDMDHSFSQNRLQFVQAVAEILKKL